MATNNALLQIGAGQVSRSPYVTAGGAGTFIDTGHNAEPIEMPFALESVDRTSERAIGIIATKIVGQNNTIVIPMLEVGPDQWRWALAQPAANLSGGSPNTLQLGDAATEYHQLKIVSNEDVADPFTTLTVLLWRCQVVSLEPIKFAQKEWVILKVTLRALRDDSVAAAGKYGTATWS